MQRAVSHKQIQPHSLLFLSLSLSQPLPSEVARPLPPSWPCSSCRRARARQRPPAAQTHLRSEQTQRSRPRLERPMPRCRRWCAKERGRNGKERGGGSWSREFAPCLLLWLQQTHIHTHTHTHIHRLKKKKPRHTLARYPSKESRHDVQE